jgi:hypothetical protein
MLDQTTRPVIAHYRGYRIVARECGGSWQARLVDIGALSAHHRTERGAINELERYLDEALPQSLA